MLLSIIESTLAVLLMLSILLQHRASGLTGSSGGTGGTMVQRRGAERVIYQSTFVFGTAFFLLIIVDWFI